MSKRIAREQKAIKKLQNQRTLEERRSEVNTIYTKLQEHGITCEMVPEFNKIANEFVEDGVNASGYVNIDGINRVLVYLLNNDKKHQISTLLRVKK